MALTVTPNLTDITMCDTTTGWLGGEGEFLLDTDVNIQGTGCMSDWVDLKLGATATYAITSTDMTGEHMYVWMYCSGVVDTKANGGYRLYASDGTNSSTWYVGGSDTHSAGGWNIFTVSFDATPDASVGTLTKTAVTSIGVAFKTLTSAPIKGQTRFNNVFWDAIRYGSGVTITSLSTDNVTMADIYAVDDGSTLKYGVVTKPSGISAYIVNGTIEFGNTGTGTCDINFDGEKIFFPSNDLVSSTFHGFQALGNATGTTTVDILGSAIDSSGVAFKFDFSGANLNATNIIGNSISNSSSPSFVGTQTVTGNVFDNCGQIDPDVVTFETNTIKNYVGAEGGALLWSGSANTKNCTFDNNLKSIEILQTVDQTYDNLTFLNEDNVTKQSTHLNNGGTSISISKNNGSNPLYYTATGGGVVTFVGASVTVQVTATLKAGTPVASAIVYLKASDGTGPFPFEDTVTIARATTVATVTHTLHGMATGDKIILKGITDNVVDNYKIKTITVTGANTYTYTTVDSGSISYTGTIKSTFVALSGTTDVNGELSTSRVYPSAQPVVGWTRKSSATPFLQEGVVVGSISPTLGFNGTAIMLGDE